MKKLVGSIAVAFLLVGCGGTEADAGVNGEQPAEVSIEKVEQGLCEGWNSGARWCTAKCGGTWYYVGSYPYVGYGDCGAAADNFCRYHFGTGASGACWSY